MNSELEAFLSRQRIDEKTWMESGLSWETLSDILADYQSQAEKLRDAAEFVARVFQRFARTHSVRWRVKDPDHLLAKIVRKRFEKSPKYETIDKSNYSQIVTDLVGVRALHLFKDDCFEIHKNIIAEWAPVEKPKAYIREGDTRLTEQFRENDIDVEVHRAGYRSVHYLISTQLHSRKVIAEIQVRTIFEEGWSEIDHQVRYPNFSDDFQVGYILSIFNRLAGSADEIGGFVKQLVCELAARKQSLDLANAERDDAIQRMTETLNEMEKVRQQDQAGKEQLAALQVELSRLRALKSQPVTKITPVIGSLASMGALMAAPTIAAGTVAALSPEILKMLSTVDFKTAKYDDQTEK